MRMIISALMVTSKVVTTTIGTVMAKAWSVVSPLLASVVTPAVSEKNWYTSVKTKL